MADDRTLTRILVPRNSLDKLQVVSLKSTTTAKVVAQDFGRRRLGFHGVMQRDPQYTLTVEFSTDDGRSFSNPATDVEGNRLVQLKCIIEQHQAEPLVRGFRTRWVLPDGWTFRDGLSTMLFDEAVSNPLILTRSIMSPGNPIRSPFEVIVEKLYL